MNNAEDLSIPAETEADLITSLVLSSAEHTLPTKRVCQHSKPFWTPALSTQLKECKAAKKRYKKRRDLNNWNHLKEAVDLFMDLYNKAIAEWWLTKCEELKSSDKNPWLVINKALHGAKSAPVQPLQKSDGEFDFDDTIIAKSLQDTHISRVHVTTAAFDQDHYLEVSNTVQQIMTEQQQFIRNETVSEIYNTDITEGEILSAISDIKPDSAPGPDVIHPMMLTNAAKELAPHLQHLFQNCWQGGIVPSNWKKDNRIYIQKPGKPNYHTEKAYRSLSLNSTVGKIYERCVTRRLIAYLHARGLFEEEQFAYLKGRDINQALLTMTLEILQGFKKGEDTIGTFIDFEGAFDAVWRDGVVHKLHRYGIRGRMLTYVHEFLKLRQSRSLVNGCTTDWVTTETGVPQGSIIAPILFIVYTADISKCIQQSHVKYADDLSHLTTDSYLTTAIAKAEDDLEKINQWTVKNRLPISIPKTEVILFSSKGHRDIVVHMNGRPLTQVTEKRILGVILDEKLTYKSHIQATSRRAAGALAKVSIFSKESKGATAEIMTLLYTAWVRPHLEFAFPIWCTASDLSPLEKVQQMALTHATGAMAHSPTAALEVITHTKPLDICLGICLVRFYLSVMRQPDDNPLKCTLLRLQTDHAFMDHRIITPIHKINSTLRYLKIDKLPQVESHHIETLDHILGHRLKPKIIAWDELGNSGRRTQEQVQEAQRVAERYLATTNGDIVAFTDGSALTNPGPCGAGAAIHWHGIGTEATEHRRPVAIKSTSYHGEIAAIALALETVLSHQPQLSNRKIHLLTDCQSALLATTSNSSPRNHTEIISQISSKITQLKSHGNSVTITWIAGHVNLAGNEKADRLAKLAAEEAQQNMGYEALPVSMQAAMNTVKKASIQIWQARWDRGDTGRWTHSLFPIVKSGHLRSTAERRTEVRRNRLILGHTRLKDNMSRIMPDFYPSPDCDCGTGRQTIEHLITHCPEHLEQRLTMLNQIETAFNTHNTQMHNRIITHRTLLGQNNHLPKPLRDSISQIMDDFIRRNPADI